MYKQMSTADKTLFTESGVGSHLAHKGLLTSELGNEQERLLTSEKSRQYLP